MRNIQINRILIFVAAMIFFPASLASAQETNALIGKWRVDDEASAYMGSTSERVSRDTILKTDTISVAGGSHGSGTLEINADGSYRLYYWWYDKLYNQGTTEGKWRVVPSGKPFGDLGAIELLDAMNKPDRSEQDRKWFVWVDAEKGEIIGRVPPHDFTGKIKLKKIGAGSSKIAPKQSKINAKNPVNAENSAQNQSTETTTPKTWTPDELRKELNGKTKQQIFALLGEPFKVSYGTYSFNNVDKIFPPCPNGCKWKSFAIRFDGAGETVTSVELQYWIVE